MPSEWINSCDINKGNLHDPHTVNMLMIIIVSEMV